MKHRGIIMPSIVDCFWARLRISRQFLRALNSAWICRDDLPSIRSQVEQILAKIPAGKRPFIFAPGLSWRRQLFQRPQQLALALAELGETVFYLDPLLGGDRAELEQLRDGLYRIAAPATALRNVRNAYLYLLPWSYSPEAFLQPAELIYDIVDDFSAFDVDRHLLRFQHARRMRNAKVVIASAQKLVNLHHSRREDIVYLPNAVDTTHFMQNNLPVPDDLRQILDKHLPTIGYFGAFAEWFEYKLLLDVASQKKQNSFILIGPDHTHQLQNSGLLDLSNVYWLGKKDYLELPAYLQYFDIAMIPFKMNEITHATSPIKLFEYMAGGKPVVVTPMEESMTVPGVLIAGNPNEFSKAIDQALILKDKSQFCDDLRNTARQNTWKARARKILAMLEMV